MMTAHVDTFARDHLPPRDQWPDLVFTLPELQYPDTLNCATELLDGALARGLGRSHRDPLARTACAGRTRSCSRRPTASRTCCVEDLRLVPGNRVLLRGPNTPMMAACWFGVVKAGGIAVATMPLLRAKELTDIVHKAQVTHALCDARLADELTMARPACPTLRTRRLFRRRCAATASRRARRASRRRSTTCAPRPTTRSLIAFTSGTTGTPEGHDAFPSRRARRVRLLAALDAARDARRRLHRQPAARVHVRPGRPAAVPAARRRRRRCWSSGRRRTRCCRRSPRTARPCCSRRRRPTARWRRRSKAHDLSSLRKCVSAGEALPAATRKLWKDATGIEIIDGIGATEMLHIFISHDEAHAQARRHGHAGARLHGVRDGRPRPAAAARTGGPARGEGADRLPLPRRRAPARLRARRLELHRRRLPRRRRRLLRLPGAHRRHDRQRGLQHRGSGGGGRAAHASGGGRVRRRRRAGRGARRRS